MAAPQIPHLNTLRPGRGRGRGRAEESSPGPRIPGGKLAADRIIQQTDHDASVSRLSAVDLGYLDDIYAGCFVPGDRPRRFPIINRGTYVRTRVIDDLIDGFLAASNPADRKQIISLGAGSDTRYFRLVAAQSAGDETARCRSRDRVIYHELDFEANVVQKAAIIDRDLGLRDALGAPLRRSVGAGSASFTAGNYHLHPIDLRLLGTQGIDASSLLPHVDRTVPTLIISECCLVYLDPEAADRVVKYFAALIPPTMPLGFVVYEPIKPEDAFGRVMVSNLATRGIVLQTLRRYGSLEAQMARMRSYGFDGSRGEDINGLWRTGVSESEKNRVAGLEMMDEVEEWELLAGHYCVAWAWRGGGEEGFWDRWRTMFTTSVA